MTSCVVMVVDGRHDYLSIMMMVMMMVVMDMTNFDWDDDGGDGCCGWMIGGRQ